MDVFFGLFSSVIKYRTVFSVNTETLKMWSLKIEILKLDILVVFVLEVQSFYSHTETFENHRKWLVIRPDTWAYSFQQTHNHDAHDDDYDDDDDDDDDNLD